MEKGTIIQRQHEILSNLSGLPRKILSFHNHNSVTELVLHTLCDSQCFNLNKAAYFVDNPDFNCLKGVAGYCRKETDVVPQGGDMWKEPDMFADKIKAAHFNQKVRTMERYSIRKGVQGELDTAREIAHDLEIENPQICLWSMKHDNHGLLIFEKSKECDCSEDMVVNGCSLLGFCPIY